MQIEKDFLNHCNDFLRILYFEKLFWKFVGALLL